MRGSRASSRAPEQPGRGYRHPMLGAPAQDTRFGLTLPVQCTPRSTSGAGSTPRRGREAERRGAGQGRAGQGRPGQGRVEQGRAECSRAGQSRADQSRAEQSRAERSRAEPSRKDVVDLV